MVPNKEEASENKIKQQTFPAGLDAVSAETTDAGRLNDVENKVNFNSILVQVLLVAIVIAIITLAFDIFRDNNVNIRITELERDIANYNKNINDSKSLMEEKMRYENVKVQDTLESQQKILGCFSFSDYWQYKRCFK